MAPALRAYWGVVTVVAVLVPQLDPARGGTYLHASKSIDGPYTPVIPPGCNDSTGIWQRNNSIPFGAGVAGGYGGGPFLVDAETAAASGLQEGNIVVITTYNYQYPRGSNKTWPDVAMHQFAAIGIAKSWRDPLVLTDKLLYEFEGQNAAAGTCDGQCTNSDCHCIPKNGSAGWRGWSMEGGELYFSKRAKRWRTIFHSFRKDFGPADDVPYGIHSGGYAESRTSDPLGDWTCYPPEVGAGYTKFVSAAGYDQVPRPPPPFMPPTVPSAPFVYGKTNMTQPAYLNMTLDTWGGNVIKEPDGTYHMMLDAMVNGQAGGLGSWESNSEVVHAISDRPEGPFVMTNVVLPTQNTNPHLLYDPTTQMYLLYTLSTGFGQCGGGMPSDRQCELAGKCMGGRCQGCHKGHCGPTKPLPAERKHMLTVDAQGYVQLGRRERPKLLLDKTTGEPLMIYNGVQYRSGSQTLTFTIATPMRPSNMAAHGDSTWN